MILSLGLGIIAVMPGSNPLASLLDQLSNLPLHVLSRALLPPCRYY